MSMHFRSTILVVAALAAGVPRVSSASTADNPSVSSATSGQGSQDLAQSSSQDSPQDSPGDNSKPTLKTPGVPSGTDVGPATDGGGTAKGDTASPSARPQPEPTNTAPPAQPAPSPAAPAPSSAGPLRGASRVEIIRSVDGEFAKARRALPGKKEGFTIFVGKPVDEQKMSDALRLQGTAIGLGEPVQITQIEFEPKRIVIQLNGGTKKKFHPLDHIQVGVGGPYGAPPDPQGVDHHEGLGAVVVLDYGRDVPDMTPADVEKELSPLLDFSKEHSAAVNWVETLPTQFQDAIRDHKALVGMDQDTVIAAIGRPDKKVRERNAQGIETEDWIYGNPPARTVFVTFIGDKVTKVEEFD